MQNKILILLSIMFLFLLCGCACVRCFPKREFDKMHFPLTSGQLEQIRSTDWENNYSTVAPLPLSELKIEMDVFKKYLLQLEIYYRQKSSIIKIDRKNLIRKEKDGTIYLCDLKGNYLNGVYTITFYKNFYAIMDICNGIPDGACILFYYTPALCSYASGYYKDGKPVNGSFPYIYETDILLPYAFEYYKGVLVNLSTNHLLSFPVWKKYNILGNNGKILNGYDLKDELKDVKLSDKIWFNYYEKGKFIKSVDLRNIAKNVTFQELYDLYNAVLNVVSSNKWSPQDWR